MESQEAKGPAAEGMAVAIAESDLRGPSINVVGAGAEFRKRMAPQLARLLVLVPPFEHAIDHSAKVDIHEILTAWRAAERALRVIPEGSTEWARVHARLVSLRAWYHELFAERCDRPPTSEVPWRVVERPA